MTATLLTDRCGHPLALYLDGRAVLGPDDAEAGRPVEDGSDEDPEAAPFRVGPDDWRRTHAEESER